MRLPTPPSGFADARKQKKRERRGRGLRKRRADRFSPIFAAKRRLCKRLQARAPSTRTASLWQSSLPCSAM